MRNESGNLLEAEIATYKAHQEELRESNPGEHWVVVKGDTIVGVYPDVDAAIEAAKRELNEEPYLLRQVRPSPFHLPSCMIAQESLLA